jgi:acetyl esterase/lipase
MKKYLCFFLLISSLVHAQPREVRLYAGPAPGSENWNWQEKENTQNMIHQTLVYNVAIPTLTIYTPDPTIATGTAVIICPGGGFHFLSINSEGHDVAKWLVKKGITAIVLKYRVAHIDTDDPLADMIAGLAEGPRKAQWQKESQATIPLSIADGKAAIVYVRSHAGELGISSNRIGIIGFSAGGTVTASAAFDYNINNRPDFVAPIYAYMPDSLQTKPMPDAPPMFLVCASDDQLGLTSHSEHLYNKWQQSKLSVEMHLYARGGHGFGMRVQHIPTDTWIERYYDWLGFLGLLKPKS